MTGPLVLALVAPLAGAVLAAAFADVPAQRRFVVAVVSAGAVGGAGWALVRTVGGSITAWRGFVADPWRALLAAGSLLAVGFALARAGEGKRTTAAQSAIFAAGAAGVVPLFVGGAHTAAVALPVSTIGFAIAAIALGLDHAGDLRARRATVALVASDVCALVGLGAAMSRGVAFPLRPGTAAGAFLLAAAVIRIGLVPAAWASEDAGRAHPALGLLWLGPVRAQGFLLLVFSLGAGRGVAYAAAACGVATALVGATRGAAERDAFPLAHAIAGIAVTGLALGGTVATWGGVLCVAATFLAWPLWHGGGGGTALAGLTLGVLPGGASIAGAVLVAGAALEGGTARPVLLVFAIPLLIAALAVGGASALASAHDRGRSAGAAALIAAAAVAATLALTALPQRATSGLVVPAAASIGTGRLLGAGDAPGIPEDLALAIIGAGLLAFAVGPGRIGEGGGSPPAAPRERRSPAFAWWSAPARAELAGGNSRTWSIAGAVLGAGAIGLAVRIFLVAAGRGFL